MKDTEELQNAIKELCIELKNTRKAETANYFYSLIEKMINSKDDVLKENLKHIINSGSITQYANFTHKEDMLFQKIHKIAKALYELQM